MKPRTFFALMIKIIGIYLVLSSIEVVPQFFSTLFSFFGNGGDDNYLSILWAIRIVISIFVWYFIILRYCLFRTDWIIDKLALDKHFTEEKIEINIHRTTVLTIAVVVIGGLMFVEALPSFCRQVFMQ